jgi:hypothetical protein
MYTYVCKCRYDSVETVPGVRREGMGYSSEGGEFKYNKYDTL